MVKNTFKLIAIIGLVSLLFSCEKDEVKVYLKDNPIAPTLISIPDLTLQKEKANDTLVFVCTPVDPGFQASIKYNVEGCAAGTDFEKITTLAADVKSDRITTTVGVLNKLMVKKFSADKPFLIDIRIRAVLVVDSGTGAPGSSKNPIAYSTEFKTVQVTLY